MARLIDKELGRKHLVAIRLYEKQIDDIEKIATKEGKTRQELLEEGLQYINTKYNKNSRKVG